MDRDIIKIAELVVVGLGAGGGAVTLWGVTRWINARVSRPLAPPERAPIEDTRLARIEMALDAIAVEVERISESQRFTAKLMAERRPNPLPPGDT